MKTIRYSKGEINDVIAMIAQGAVVAFPTDTVFGVGVVYDNEQALHHLKAAKLRSDEKPIPMMVSSLSQIKNVAVVSEEAETLMQHFMPGAFTIVLKRKKDVPAYVSNGLDTIAIRMPKDELLLHIMERVNKPLLVSSANLSNHKPCQNSDEVLSQLEGRIDAIILGESGSETASTIVDASDCKIKVLREGTIKEDAIHAFLRSKKNGMIKDMEVTDENSNGV